MIGEAFDGRPDADAPLPVDDADTRIRVRVH